MTVRYLLSRTGPQKSLIATGDGERILPHQIVERFTGRADGELEPLTGSTKPVAEPERTRALSGSSG
jgi:hypothetical protein